MAQPVFVGPSPRRPRFEPRPGRVRLVLDKVAMGQVYYRVHRFPPVSVILRTLATHLHLNTVVMKRGSRRSLGRFELLYDRLISRTLLLRILVICAVKHCDDVNREVPSKHRDDVNRAVPSKHRDALTPLHNVTSQKIEFSKKCSFGSQD